MRRVYGLSLLLFAGGCKYITDTQVDPADPLLLSLYNAGTETAYLALGDEGSPLDASVHVRQVGGDVFRGSAGCAGLCSDGCAVPACAAAPAVRAVAPGQGLLVEWGQLRFDDATMRCSGEPERLCRTAQRASKGHYEVTVCFGRAVRQADPAFALQRTSGDPQRIDGALVDGETCLDPVRIAVPGSEVRWGVTLP